MYICLHKVSAEVICGEGESKIYSGDVWRLHNRFEEDQVPCHVSDILNSNKANNVPGQNCRSAIKPSH